MPSQYPRGRAPIVVAGMSRRRCVGAGLFRSAYFYGSFAVAGVTRDSAGVALGNCVVKLFETGTDRELAEVTSDTTTGVFSFSVGGNSTLYYLVAYKQGSPDVAGTTVNTVRAT